MSYAKTKIEWAKAYLQQDMERSRESGFDLARHLSSFLHHLVSVENLLWSEFQGCPDFIEWYASKREPIKEPNPRKKKDAGKYWKIDGYELLKDMRVRGFHRGPEGEFIELYMFPSGGRLHLLLKEGRPYAIKIVVPEGGEPPRRVPGKFVHPDGTLTVEELFTRCWKVLTEVEKLVHECEGKFQKT